MADGNLRHRGRVLVGAYLTAREGPPGPAQALLRATMRAGQATDLAMRIRRHGRLNGPDVVAFAALCGLGSADVNDWVLDALAAADMVDVERQQGHLIAVEERVGVAAGVLEQSVALWEHEGP